MKKTFLKGLIASTTVALTMVVGTVGAFAAAIDNYGTYAVSTTTNTNDTATWGFTSNMPAADVKVPIGDTVNGILVRGTKDKTKLSKSNYLSANTDAEINIPVPAGSAGTLTVKGTSGNTSRFYNLYINDVVDSSGRQIVSNSGEKTLDFTASDISTIDNTTYLQFKVSGGEMKTGSFKVVLSTGQYEVGEVWPTIDTQTSSVTNVSGDVKSNISSCMTANTSLSAEVTGLDNTGRVRIGKAFNATITEAPDLGLGYIKFTAAEAGIVAIDAASSGSEREVCIGTYDNVALSPVDTTIVMARDTYALKVPAAGVYYIYGNTIENFDVYTADFYTGNATLDVTPSVKLSEAIVDSEGLVTFTCDFNGFTTSNYEVQTVTVNAAKVGSDSWTEFSISNIKDNGDGTFTFTVKCNNLTEKAKFQVVVDYTDSSSNNVKAVSNAILYTPAA